MQWPDFRLSANDDVKAVRQELELQAASANELQGRTPVATPIPLGIGEPGAGYPLPWSVFTWLAGEPATADSGSQSDSFAIDLAHLILAVRAIDTCSRTYDGNGRGGDLASYDEWIELCLANSAGLLDVASGTTPTTLGATSTAARWTSGRTLLGRDGLQTRIGSALKATTYARRRHHPEVVCMACVVTSPPTAHYADDSS